MALALLAVAGLGWLGWRWWFPPDAVVIERSVRKLVEILPVEKQESTFVQIAKASRIADFFTLDVSIQLEGIARISENIQGRAQLQQMVAAARNRWPALRFEVPSVMVTVNPDGQTGLARLGMLIWQGAEPDPLAQELRLTFRKDGSKWLIAVVEPVLEKPIVPDTR